MSIIDLHDLIWSGKGYLSLRSAPAIDFLMCQSLELIREELPVLENGVQVAEPNESYYSFVGQ